MPDILWQSKPTKAPEEGPPVSMPQAIWEVLFSRGLASMEDIDIFFSPSLKDLTHPLKLNNMQKTVDRLIEAFDKKEAVLIYGDFDLDGTSGLSLLYTGLEELGFENIHHYQPKRLSEGYGVHVAAIEKLKAELDIDVVVTVDVGITDVKAAKRAKELGIDFIITDHHLPKEVLPEAYAIVNPNTEECDSGLGHLCGTGVAFYLVLALRTKMNELGHDTTKLNPKSLLDFFTIGTITDMVPLVKENRTLIKHGLLELSRTNRPGLKELLRELGLYGKKLSAGDVAMRFAPKLNALSRIEAHVMPVDIYLEKNSEKASSLISQVMKNNQLRIKLQGQAEREAVAWVANNPQEGYIWIYSENFHKGIIGLVATKLTQLFNVPAFVGALTDEGKITGSSRLPKARTDSLVDALGGCSDALKKFGGHAPAAGFETHIDDAEAFNRLLDVYYKENKFDSETEMNMEYDLNSELSDINDEFMKWYDGLEPFGSSNELPIFKFENLELKTFKNLKGGHFKMNFKSDSSAQKIDALWFSPDRTHPLIQADAIKVAGVYSLLAEVQWNYFAGRKSLQLLIKDIKSS